MLKPRSALLASVCLLPAILASVPLAARAQPAPAAASVPAGGTIAAINVSGNQRIDSSTIQSYMVVQPGGPFDPTRINESLKTLYATGLFSNVSISRDGSSLNVAVAENPTVSQVLFAGNKVITDDDAGKAVALKARSVFTPAAAEADRRALLQAYAKKGYYNAQVTPAIVQLPDNRVNVVFQCVDGAQTLISRIIFIGNDHFSQSALRQVVSTRQYAWFRFLSSSDQYDPDRVQYDEYLIHKFYLHHGYADVNIISANAELAPDRKSFYLTYDIVEGPRYRIASLKVVSSIRTLDDSKLRGLVPLSVGGWFDGDALQEGVEALSTKAQNLGYAFATVNPDVQTNPDKKTINITLNVIDGPEVYIQRIDITGNTRTEDKVIRRELTVAEGDAYNQSKIDKSTSNLKDLGYFKDPKITSAPGSTPQQVILNTKVAEQATGQFSLGGGYSTSLGALVNAGLSQNNFLGTGNNASVSALLAQRGTQINLGVSDPYFLDRNLIAGWDLFRTVTDSYTAAQQGYSYSESSLGTDFRLGWRYNSNVRQSFSYTISTRDVYGVASGSSTYITQQAGNSVLSQVSQTLDFDYVDDDQAPTSGLNLSITTDFAGVGGTAKYARVSPNASYYIPLEHLFGSKLWVLKFSATGGDLIPLFGYQDKIVDRFFLGGDNLRGFADGAVGPATIQTAEDNAKNVSFGGQSVGGRILWTESTQLQFPLPVSPDLGVSGFAFADIGALVGTKKLIIDPTYGPQPVQDNGRPRMGVGFGVSWNTPFGLINLSLANPVIKYSGDQTQSFRVSFGTRF